MRIYLLLFVTLFPVFVSATTTEGAIMRNVQIDGNVQIGGLAGANGIVWETDEEFQGFGNASTLR